MRAVRLVRSWMRTIIELNTRPAHERDEFRNPPLWLRRALLFTLLLDVYGLTQVLYDLPAVGALTAVYGVTMLVPPVASPLGMIRTPRVAFLITLMLLWSPLHVLVAISFGTLLAVLIFRLYEFWRAAINTVWWAFPAALGSFIGHTVLRATPGRLLGLTAASLAILTVYLLANFALLALYRHLRHGDGFFAYWWSCLRENPLSQVLAAPVPILLGAIAIGLGQERWTNLGLTALSAVTMPTVRLQLAVFLASQRTVQDIVRSLMIALERVVPGARAHAERVSDLVTEMGLRLRVSTPTLESWRMAALLHDIGLIDSGSRGASAVSHAIVGARILDSYPDQMVADMVREHHTPWSAIPPRLRSTVVLGAQVLAAAESYDELRYGTPSKPGLSGHAATVGALSPLAGKYLNPRVTAVLFEAAERLDMKAAS